MLSIAFLIHAAATQPTTKPAFNLTAEVARVSATWTTTGEGYRVAGAGGIGEIVIPPGFHVGDIDLTNTHGISVRGLGFPTIVGNVDLTGAVESHIYSVQIRGDLEMARDASARSAGHHWIAAVRVDGHARLKASEANLFMGCVFTSPDALPAFSASNGTPPATCLQNTFNGCQFNNFAGGACLELVSNGAITGDFIFTGGGMSTGENDAIQSPQAVLVRSNTQFQQVQFYGMRFETRTATAGFRIIGAVPVNGLVLEGCTHYQRTFWVDARTMVMNGCRFRCCAVDTYPVADWGVGGLIMKPGAWSVWWSRPLVLCRQAVGDTRVDSSSARLPNGTDWPATVQLLALEP